MSGESGLKKHHLDEIREILDRHPEVEKAIIFGSRAKGTYRKASDIDIAIFGKRITLSTLLSLMSDFEESHLPYFVDVVDYKKVDKKLREEIDQFGKLIYIRKVK